MKAHIPFRLGCGTACLVLLAASTAFARGFGQRPAQHNRAVQRAETRTQSRATQPPQVTRSSVNPPAPAAQPRQGHLQQWIENHKSLTPAEQHRALQDEPGFRELDPETQQRELNQLDRLNSMPPEERNRYLNGVEGLERLSPQQQQQWDRSVQQLHSSPVPRRRLMIRAIADLREMPAEQRQQVIDSPAFGAQFSPDERQTIRTVLTAYPPGRPAAEVP